MKKIVIIFLLIFLIAQAAVCQDEIIYRSNNMRLSIDFRTKEYYVWEDAYPDSNSDAIEAPTYISEGKITANGNLITCVDRISANIILLKKIDEYRLVVENKSNCFNVNDTLYASVISDQNGRPYQWLKWKDGKRHGLWSTDGEKGVNYTLYEKGRIIKQYFKTYKELSEESDDSSDNH